MADRRSRQVGRRWAEVVHERAGQEVPVLVVDHPLEQGGASAVGEAAAYLPLDEERVEQPAGVVHRDVVQDAHLPRRPLDLDHGQVGEEPVRARRGDAILVVRRREVGRGVERGLVQPGSDPRRERLGVPVDDPGKAP
jgi:hypothetical protein